jgi:hypothetical protein
VRASAANPQAKRDKMCMKSSGTGDSLYNSLNRFSLPDVSYI